jgi:hypothetical protein
MFCCYNSIFSIIQKAFTNTKLNLNFFFKIFKTFYQEKIQLEKEKLRLQELEIKQREKDLQEKLKRQEEFKPLINNKTNEL